MIFVEYGTVTEEMQGSFAPERLAGKVWSRRFYAKQDNGLYTVITVEVGTVFSESNEGMYYPEMITEICRDEKDYQDIDGSNSDYEYDSDISYVDFATVEECDTFGSNEVQRLDVMYL